MAVERALLSFLCALVLLGTAAQASAQSLDPILDSGIDRTASDRSDAKTRLQINYDDCIADDVMQFQMKVRNNSDYSLEVWASSSSADCTTSSNRQGTAPDCWIVFSDRPTSIDYVANIPVRNIVAQTKGTSEVTQATADACEKDLSATLTLYFILTSGGEIQGTSQKWSTAVDLVGPQPPASVTVSAGEDRLQVGWDASESSADRLGYKIYCVPLTDAIAAAPRHFLQVSTGGTGTDAGVTDAGGIGVGGSSGAAGTSAAAGSAGTGGSAGTAGATTTVDAGTTTSSSTDPACAGIASELVAGQRPPVTLEPCGSTGRTAPDGVATGLQNGVLYAVAVSGVDALDNRGPLSNVTCGTPEVVTDFFELYRGAGGKGGGGFCALLPAGTSPSPFTALASLALISGLLLARRSRAIN